MFIRTAFVRYLTFGFASAITLYPFVLIGKQTPLTRRLVNHERIHLHQQAELLILPFYLLYLLEYLLRYLSCKNTFQAYRNISFEREAYKHDENMEYLINRPLWNWRHYI